MLIDEMRIQDVSVEMLVMRYGTPSYIYSSENVISNYKLIRNSLDHSIEIFYSMKSNPNISIVALLARQGANVEVASIYELGIALRAGVKPNKIIFVGPSKTESELIKSISLRLNSIVCESINELHMVSKLSMQQGVRTNVAIRINPNFICNGAPLKMGGRASQFGIDIDELLKVEERILKLGGINICGVHIYNATRLLDEASIIENTRQILDLSRFLMGRWSTCFQFIDIGGGLGIPYYEDELALDFAILSSGLNKIVQDFNQFGPNVKIYLESGRYLVANAGVFITKINDKKTSKGINYLITDGGTNCHLSAVGIGSVIKKNFPIFALKYTEANEYEMYNIVGPLCTPGDLLARQVSLPVMEIGEFIGISQSGAYGPTASPGLFLSHGFPSEILIHNSEAHLVRSRDNLIDILNKQSLISL
jgi:diaminopimelate decarboxylase